MRVSFGNDIMYIILGYQMLCVLMQVAMHLWVLCVCFCKCVCVSVCVYVYVCSCWGFIPFVTFDWQSLIISSFCLHANLYILYQTTTVYVVILLRNSQTAGSVTTFLTPDQTALQGTKLLFPYGYMVTVYHAFYSSRKGCFLHLKFNINPNPYVK